MSGEGHGGSGGQGHEEKPGNSLWSLLPGFDPSIDDAKEYGDKVRFLWGICPAKDRGMLAPRLAMLRKGTAWAHVKMVEAARLTDPDTGVKALLDALSSWMETSEMQTYERFERAIYKTMQKSDESTMSFANRIQVAFHEVGENVTLGQVKAFVMLRQSNLQNEDKRKVIESSP